MRTTPVGLVMLNDERPHVVAANEADNMRELRAWADAIGPRLEVADGCRTALVVGSETVQHGQIGSASCGDRV